MPKSIATLLFKSIKRKDINGTSLQPSEKPTRRSSDEILAKAFCCSNPTIDVIIAANKIPTKIRKSHIELSTYMCIIETFKTMKGKATMALVLSLVVGIIINYGVMTPTAKVFATAIGEHQPPEAKQHPLSEQQRYNAAAMKVLAQMSTPVNKTLPKTTSITDTGTEIQYKNDNC